MKNYFVIKPEKVTSGLHAINFCAKNKVLFYIIATLEHSGQYVIESHSLRSGVNNFNVDYDTIEPAPEHLVVAARLRGEL